MDIGIEHGIIENRYPEFIEIYFATNSYFPKHHQNRAQN